MVLERLPDSRFLSDLAKDFWIIRKRPWVKKTILTLSSLSILAVASFALFLFYYTDNLRDFEGNPLNFDKFKESPYNKTTYVYSNDGELTGRFFFQVRDPLRYDEVPEMLKNGFIAAEDKRFFHWSHFGIDLRAIARAFVFNQLSNMGIEYFPRSGGSGIFQQYVRKQYEDEVPAFRNMEQSYWRKIEEAQVAVQLFRRYSKEEVLAAFLNIIWLGHGNYGVAEGARFYFGKEIRKEKLTLRDIAILASLNKSAARYCPIFHKPAEPKITADMTEEEVDRLRKKYEADLAVEMTRITLAKGYYNTVLGRMLGGVFDEEYITEEEYQAALFKSEPLEITGLNITPIRRNNDFGYFNRMVKEVLLTTGYKDEDITHHGGYHIRTCSDRKLQKILNEELSAHLTELNSEINDRVNPLNGSAVIIDIKTGCIAALSGGHDYGETRYNRALAARSMGSAAKLAVYGAALEAGKDFYDPVCNCPLRMRGANGKPWIPKNFPENRPVPRGYNPLAVGLIRSVNIPTIRLAQEITMEKVVDFTHRLGIWGNRGIIKDPEGKIVFRIPGIKDQGDRIVPQLPTAIGASDGNLIEWVNGMAQIIRGGTYLPPRLIQEIKDSEGKILYEMPEAKPKRYISKDAATKLTVLTRAVTEVGTLKISMRNIEQEVVGKTGTSNNPDRSMGRGPGDVTVISGTPELVMGIRLGHDVPKPIMVPQYMERMSGIPNMQISAGWLNGPLSRRIWDRVYTDRPKVEFPNVIKDRLEEFLANYPDKYR